MNACNAYVMVESKDCIGETFGKVNFWPIIVTTNF